uniref:claudin-8-like n=1 Tax=Monopterus albus TaxID=43700 RepID=UPI0009B312F5|nr:claudin-8-like [Monopterus albus]
MANSSLEIAGALLTVIGLIGAAASTGMPMWRVTAFIGENIIVFETRYEGLWMNCYRQANIRMQCKVYDSLLALSPDLQAARGLMCCSLALAGIGLMISLVGMQCISCIENNNRAKRMILIIAGSLIIMACLCVLIPVSWTGHVIIMDFYNPLLIDAQRRELGEALYIGWVASAFLFAGGCMFTCCNLQSDDKGSERYIYSRPSDYMVYPPQPLQPQQLVVIPQQQPQPQPMLSRHPSANYSYHSRYPSVRSGVAYL